MKVNTVKGICGIIEHMEDEKIARLDRIVVQDVSDGSKYVLLRIEEGEKIYKVNDEEEDEQ